jgi:poly(3-hydroxybutyrate) depolymerase
MQSAELIEYEFEDWSGSSLPTYVAKPNNINAETRLIVVMHGRKRNAEDYRDQWVKASQDLNLVVIVPEFSEKNFSRSMGF